MATIYLITNKINNKSYIGLTIRDNVKERWREHCKKSRSGVSALTSAILKYGKNNFEFTVLEYTAFPESREQYYIKQYNTLSPNGYNLTTGGESPKFTEKELVRRSEFMKGKPGYNLGKKQDPSWCEARIKNRRKSVIGINIKDNTILEFVSVTAAGRYFNAGSSAISAVCLGKYNSAYGYKWKFKEVI